MSLAGKRVAILAEELYEDLEHNGTPITGCWKRALL